MAEKMRGPEEVKKAGTLATLAAVVGLTTAGFAEQANAYTQGVCPEGATTGTAWTHKEGEPYGTNELLVGPDGKPCAVFTPAEREIMDEQDRDGGDREPATGGNIGGGGAGTPDNGDLGDEDGVA